MTQERTLFSLAEGRKGERLVQGLLPSCLDHDDCFREGAACHEALGLGGEGTAETLTGHPEPKQPRCGHGRFLRRDAHVRSRDEQDGLSHLLGREHVRPARPERRTPGHDPKPSTENR